LPPDTPEAIVKLWAESIERITDDLTTAVSNKRCWEEVNAMWGRNRALRVPSDAPDWIARMHADSAALAVRKQLDRHPESVSLWKLLDDLERRARFMTVEAHLRGVERADLRAILAENTAEWVEPGTQHFDPAIAAADRALLEAEGQLAREWANRSAAHADAKGPRREVTYGDLTQALAVVVKLAVKYSLIVRCISYGLDLMPHRQFDASLVFRRPWHRPEWKKREWPAGWIEREGDLVPSIDVLTRENFCRLVRARHSIVRALRETWAWDAPEESPIRRVLESLALPTSDAAVLWTRDYLLQRGHLWEGPPAP
jgi:hypothetical protein